MSAEFADSIVIEQDFTTLDTYDGSERPLVPPGAYVLRVNAISQKNGNGKPMLEVEFEVAEGEHAGTKVWNNYMLQSKDNTGLKRLKQFMVAGGGNLDRFDSTEYIGVSIRAEVIHTEGAARVGADGAPLPSKTFANVVKEMPLEEEQPAAKSEPPPIVKGKTAGAKPAARRA